jgi:hypothetical protein
MQSTLDFRVKRKGRATLNAKSQAVRSKAATQNNGLRQYGNARFLCRCKEIDSRPKAPERIKLLVSIPIVQSSPEDEVNDDQRVSLHVHQPRSETSRLISDMMDTMMNEGADYSWLQGLPMRIGSSNCVDASVTALVTASRYGRDVPGYSSAMCHTALANALLALRQTVERSQSAQHADGALSSAACLAPFASIKGEHNMLDPWHLEGIVAILTSPCVVSRATDNTREVLRWFCCDAMTMAVIKGTPSPLEDLHQSHYDASNCWPAGGFVTTLRSLATELSIKLPRLITIVKALRRIMHDCRDQSRFARMALAERAHALIEALDALKDDKAESSLLHSIQIMRTSSMRSGRLITTAFDFGTLEIFDAALYYWSARLSLMRLQLKLLESCTSPVAEIDHELTAEASSQALYGEMSRVVRNLIMSVHYGSGLRARKRNRLSAHSIVTAWGALQDVPAIAIDVMKSRPGLDGESGIASLRAWLIDTVMKRLAISPADGFSTVEMNEAADMFVGGAVDGRYAMLYAMPSEQPGKVVLESINRDSP